MGVEICFILIVAAAVLPSIEAKNVSFTMRGNYCPVFTSMSADGNLNLDIVASYARFIKDKGFLGVLVNGGIGEGPTLTVCDAKRNLNVWTEAAGQLDLGVISEVSGRVLSDAQELARHSEERGVNAIRITPELYYKPTTPKELVYDVQLIAREAPNTPVLYFDYPERTKVNVDMVEFNRQATEMIRNYKGIQTTNFATALKLRTRLIGDQRVINADSIFLESAIMLDINSIIIESNLFPSTVRDIVKSAKRGNFKRSTSLYDRLRRISDVISARGKVLASYKAAMPMITGISVGPIREPEIRLNNDEKSMLEEELRQQGIKIIDWTAEK